MTHPNDLKAVILDLDGVITHTAEIHAAAWKKMFDSFLYEYSKRTRTSFRPMDPVQEYKLYVDGRPRYEGAQAFLLAREINLPYGTPDDKAGVESVCGLANKKNEIYVTLLHKRGAHVYPDTIDAIKQWRHEHKKTAVISASKNCREVLTGAGITDLFDAIVDGVDSVANHIKGKPEPDIFLFAAKQLQVDPSEAAIVEDAPAGVKAGKSGHFAFVIGVSRNSHARLLYENGADIVVSSLNEISNSGKYEKRPAQSIPSALQNLSIIKGRIKKDSLLLLLDYDGTLTPIVERPDLAVLADTMRNVLMSLSDQVMVAVVSGRDLADVKRLVGLPNIFYAGSHGFEIAGPGDLHFEIASAKEAIPVLDMAEHDIRNRLTEIKGIIVERKRFGLAVHYRLIDENKTVYIRKFMYQLAKSYDQLDLTLGKKVFELRPRISWNKGKAVTWLADNICNNKQATDTFKVYIGDDLTDEDAFREVKDSGIGILVGNHGSDSYADYRLENVGEVEEFLRKAVGCI